MKPINPILYYTEYFDANGHKHYAVHKYKPDGWVWSMRDYKFQDNSQKSSYMPKDL